MSQLAVITFDDEESAGKALASLRQVEKAGALKINDTAVIVKDKQGNLSRVERTFSVVPRPREQTPGR